MISSRLDMVEDIPEFLEFDLFSILNMIGGIAVSLVFLLFNSNYIVFGLALSVSAVTFFTTFGFQNLIIRNNECIKDLDAKVFLVIKFFQVILLGVSIVSIIQDAFLNSLSHLGGHCNIIEPPKIGICGEGDKMTEKLKLKLDSPLKGRILDIGGGGEGIIGQIYRQQVIAIDNSQEELDEAPDVCRKMLMDATSLCFESCEFDHVTAFYSLMYMFREEQGKVIKEAYRVLKVNGKLHIWDTVITNAYPAPFTVSLDIIANGTMVHVTYGIVKTDVQNMELFVSMCQEAGMKLLKKSINSNQIYLQFTKDAQ